MGVHCVGEKKQRITNVVNDKGDCGVGRSQAMYVTGYFCFSVSSLPTEKLAHISVWTIFSVLQSCAKSIGVM